MAVVKAEHEGGARPPLSTRARDYFSSLKYEWQKVTFPDRKQWINSTIIVFIFTLLLMVIIFLFDLLVSTIFKVILGH